MVVGVDGVPPLAPGLALLAGLLVGHVALVDVVDVVDVDGVHLLLSDHDLLAGLLGCPLLGVLSLPQNVKV